MRLPRLYPLRLWPDESHYDFMRLRHLSFPLSAAISVGIVVIFLMFGLNYGVDFKGGTLMEMQPKTAEQRLPVASVREKANAFGFGEVEVQEFGNDGAISLRFPIQPGGEQAQGVVTDKARAEFGGAYSFERVETVGPRVSGELVQSGTIGVILSVVAVLAYLWFRFERELAIAAIVGYSLNETVVVFDRTRELLRRYKTMPTIDLLNLSINTTMSRTAITSMTTILSLVALVWFGGRAIEGFAQVMLAGVFICTYSAILISTPTLIYIGVRQGQRREAREEGRVPQPAE